MLVIHIMAGGAWFGLDVAMAVLIFTAIGSESTAVRANSLQSLALVTVWPMFTTAVLNLVTGVLLGLGSKYGLFRYWWVVTALAYQLHPVGPLVLGGPIYWPLEQAEAVLKFLRDFAPTPPTNSESCWSPTARRRSRSFRSRATAYRPSGFW